MEWIREAVATRDTLGGRVAHDSNRYIPLEGLREALVEISKERGLEFPKDFDYKILDLLRSLDVALVYCLAKGYIDLRRQSKMIDPAGPAEQYATRKWGILNRKIVVVGVGAVGAFAEPSEEQKQAELRVAMKRKGPEDESYRVPVYVCHDCYDECVSDDNDVDTFFYTTDRSNYIKHAKKTHGVDDPPGPFFMNLRKIAEDAPVSDKKDVFYLTEYVCENTKCSSFGEIFWNSASASHHKNGTKCGMPLRKTKCRYEFIRNKKPKYEPGFRPTGRIAVALAKCQANIRKLPKE
jgi:hypothetical protein